jgi:hypothetical protein
MSQKKYENQQPEQQIQQSTSLWSQMAGQFLESLTDKNMTAIMELQNLMFQKHGALTAEI